jgi:hypothetical protein
MNHKFFVLFVGYTMVSCLFSLCIIGIRTLQCGIPSLLSPGTKETAAEKIDCLRWDESYAGLALLVVSVVFFLFTSCMLAEQIEAIKSNTSKIARMKMSVGVAGTELKRVTEEFNEMFGGENNRVAMHWFIPMPIEFPNGMKKVVLGYDWDETFDALPYQEPDSGDVEIGSSLKSVTRIELTKVPHTASLNENQTSGKGDPKLVRRNSRDCNREYDRDDPFIPQGGTLT